MQAMRSRVCATRRRANRIRVRAIADPLELLCLSNLSHGW
jgi:hypothetical protein